MRYITMAEQVLANESQHPHLILGFARVIRDSHERTRRAVTLLRGELRPVWRQYWLSVRQGRGTGLSRRNAGQNASKQLGRLYPRDRDRFFTALSDFHLCTKEINRVGREMVTYSKLMQQDVTPLYQFISRVNQGETVATDAVKYAGLNPKFVSELLAFRIMRGAATV